MRRWAFVFAILGIISLFMILFFTNYIEIRGQGEIENMIENSKVRIIGMVESERNWGDDKLLVLDNEVEVISRWGNLEGKNIEVYGLVDDFGKKRIKAERIVVLY